jgi:hypothetical protein
MQRVVLAAVLASVAGAFTENVQQDTLVDAALDPKFKLEGVNLKSKPEHDSDVMDLGNSWMPEPDTDVATYFAEDFFREADDTKQKERWPICSARLPSYPVSSL